MNLSLSTLQMSFDSLEKWADRKLIRLNEGKCKVLYLGLNNARKRRAEPESICTEKLFELCTLNMNQECVPVVMKADCVLGFISEYFLQVNGWWDSIRSILPHFWFSSAKKDIEKKVAQVGGHWDPLWMDANIMPGEALRSGWIFFSFKTEGYNRIYVCLQLLHAVL